MIQLREILDLSLFKNFHILCGRDYLSNTVNTAVILEYESSRIHYAGYCYGYFVLVSYFWASTNPDLVHDAIRTLIEKKVSGLAIKMLPDERLPSELIELAVNNHVPIFTFYDEFMEDLIININESVKTRSQYIIMEQKLNSILNEKKSNEEIIKIAKEINPDFKRNIYAAYLTSKEPASNLQILTYFNNLMYHKSKLKTDNTYSFIKFGRDIVLIASFDENQSKKINILQHIKELLSTNRFEQKDFYIGYSKKIEGLQNISTVVKKSQIAALCCKYKKNQITEYDEVGIYKFALSIIKDEILSIEVKNKIEILKEYDKAHESQLIKTLVCLVENNGDYNKTAKECFGHTNTIRYRIKKAEQLLDLEEDTADEEITFLIRCYLIIQSLSLK